MKARLYYEAHITVNEGTDFASFAEWQRGEGMRASRFSEDEVDDYNGKWFLSYRNEDLQTTKSVIAVMCSQLEKCGYTVLRWKIEDTVLDSKYGDALE